MKKAYRTTWSGITSIVAAESVAQARSRTQASANSAGYSPKWCEIRVVRATEHDGWAEVDETASCSNEEDLPKASVTT